MQRTSAEQAWNQHFAGHQAAKAGGQPPPRPGDWVCPKCWPRVNNFASKIVCYKCGEPKPPPGTPLPEPEPVGPVIRFGVRGDSFLQTRHDTAKLKKYRNFKPNFEQEFYAVFGNCTVDHSLNVGENINEVTKSIVNGPAFEILCVGISIQDLMHPTDWNKVGVMYPATLDLELQNLALAIRSKASGSMVWVGGPAEFWGRSQSWDNYMERARNTLRKAGVQVVPAETIAYVMQQITLSNDELHIANLDHEKEAFAKAWAACLYAAASDPTWGRAVTDDGAPSLPAMPSAVDAVRAMAASSAVASAMPSAVDAVKAMAAAVRGRADRRSRSPHR